MAELLLLNPCNLWWLSNCMLLLLRRLQLLHCILDVHIYSCMTAGDNFNMAGSSSKNVPYLLWHQRACLHLLRKLLHCCHDVLLRAVAHCYGQQQLIVVGCACLACCYLLLQWCWQAVQLAHEVQPHAILLQLWQLLLQR